MSALKLVSNPKPMYNVAQEHTKKKNMESKPVNPDRAIDQKLVEKAQKGDKKAFGILVEKYNKNSLDSYLEWSETNLRSKILFKILSLRLTGL